MIGERTGVGFDSIGGSSADPAPPLIVIPAEAGIQPFQALAMQSLDPRVRGDDGKEDSGRRRNGLEQAGERDRRAA